MWNDGIVHVLPEQRGAAIAVQRDSVGNFDEVELFFLGEDLFDVWLKEGVGFEDFVADCSLGGGLYFRLCAGGESGRVLGCCWRSVGLGTY